MPHPVADLLLAAWRGPRPVADGTWQRVPPWRTGVYAVVAVTGRAVVSAPDEVTDAEIEGFGPDGFGRAHDPRLMAHLAGATGWVDVLDAVLLAEGTGAGPAGLVPRPDLAAHPRVQHAAAIRDDLSVWGPPHGDGTVVTLGRGLGGLPEMSLQVAEEDRGRGMGTPLAQTALGLVPAGSPLVACVSPANVPSVRALLGAGFEPVGSVQVYRPA